MDALFNKTMNMLSGMLDYRTKRHKIIVSNITNMDAFDFKPSDISFKNEFVKADTLVMTTTAPGHIARRMPDRSDTLRATLVHCGRGRPWTLED